MSVGFSIKWEAMNVARSAITLSPGDKIEILDAAANVGARRYLPNGFNDSIRYANTIYLFIERAAIS